MWTPHTDEYDGVGCLLARRSTSSGQAPRAHVRVSGARSWMEQDRLVLKAPGTENTLMAVMRYVDDYFCAEREGA